MPRYLIIILLSYFVNIIPAFSQEYVFNRKIITQYHQDYIQLQIKLDGKTFEKGQNNSSKINIYYYLENFQISNLANVTVNIEKITSKVLNRTVKISQLPEEKSFEIYSSRGEKFLCLKYLPYYINDEGFLCEIDSVRIIINGDKIIPEKQNISEINSELNSGIWLKVGIAKNGIYKLDIDILRNLGFDDLSKLRIFGNGYGQLPYMNDQDAPVDLSEIPIYETEDEIYFYAKGPDNWIYSITEGIFIKSQHKYSNLSYYFITDKPGNPKRVSNIPNLSDTPVYTSETYSDYRHHELDSISILHSGQDWYGEHFEIDLKHDVNFNLGNFVASEEMKIKLGTAVRSTAETSQNTISISVNNEELSPAIMHLPIEFSLTSNYVSLMTSTFSIGIPSEEITIGLDFNKANNFSEAWLDYITLNYRSNLKYEDNPLFFRDVNSISPGSVSEFRISSELNDLLIWDVTNHNDVKAIIPDYDGEFASFRFSSDSLREFVTFSPNHSIVNYPEIIGFINNQNLHSLDNQEMIIISSNDLMSEAGVLSDFHNSRGLKTKVVLVDHIYNEFSCGMPDVSAIRNFIRQHYLKSKDSDDALKYVLLFGDGSFDNRIKFIKENPTTILTYQSKNSILPTGSFVSDDFFGLMDENEGEAQGLLDLGIGRLPVSNHEEAMIVINKIFKYYEESSFGAWRNNLLFVADDGDFGIHLEQAEYLTSYVDTSNSIYNISKIYYDAYLAEENSGNTRFPGATQQINKELEDGVLILNYTGHGSELGLGGELVINTDDILSWSNTNKMNLFMTATCEFSRFDEYDRTTAGELILLNPNGGSVALFSTTRLVFSTPNFILNQNFFKQVLNKPTSGNRLGDVMRKTKINSGQGNNKRNFTLIGDPALELSLPVYNIEITEINGIPVALYNDTIFGLSKVELSGQVINGEGELIPDLNGEVNLKVFDQRQIYHTIGNGENDILNFDLYDNVLFNGVATLIGGAFTISFIVPKDISQSFGKAKVSLYVSGKNQNNIFVDGHGFKRVDITGSIIENLNDNIGPSVDISFDNRDFEEGGYVSVDPLITLFFADSSGINTTGLSIGRNIVAQLDNDPAKLFYLNDRYESDIDSYQSGKASFNPGELEFGSHELVIKVWDVANNMTEKRIFFEVIENIDPVINRVFNYPNPFTNDTKFYIEHNYIGRSMEVQITIQSISGRLVKTINNHISCENELTIVGYWDGLDDFGNKLGRGTYFYQIDILGDNNKRTTVKDKLVILK